MKFTSVFCILLCAATSALANTPKVPSDAPYIVLADNVDEPNGYGFCLDTAGRGMSDFMQSHSCKPAAKDDAGNPTPNDTQFLFDAKNMRVESVAYPGVCMQVLISRYSTAFALLDCSEHIRQKFIYSPKDKTLVMEEDQAMCVSVVSVREAAGPWSRRELALTSCVETEDALKQWTYVAE